jgi:hypothetical protein
MRVCRWHDVLGDFMAVQAQAAVMRKTVLNRFDIRSIFFLA